MSKPSLVVLAAGLGSRFGGDKQITPVDNDGRLIIDFSVFDAYRAGFRKVIFIIQPQMQEAFHAAIGRRAEEHMEVAYAFQTMDRFLPEGFQIPEGRKKPWGTAHAVLCARDEIEGPFAVINADDFYGASAYRSIYRFLINEADDTHHAMVGYRVEKTLAENGAVSRGVCSLDENGYLSSVVERVAITPFEGGARFTEDGGVTYSFLPAGTLVSMNMWGFGKGILQDIETGFVSFLKNSLPVFPEKAEYYLPSVPDQLIHAQKAKVKVLSTEDQWYGVTFPEDLPSVKKAIAELKRTQYEDIW